MQIRYLGFDQREIPACIDWTFATDGRMSPSADRITTEHALAQLGNVMVASAFCRR